MGTILIKRMDGVICSHFRNFKCSMDGVKFLFVPSPVDVDMV